MKPHIARIFLVIVVAFSLSTVTFAQRTKSRRDNNSVRLQKDKPTVYISFVRFGQRDSFRTVDSENGVYLKLHNNTRWNLVLRAYGAGGYKFTTADAEEIGMFYGVEEVPKSRKQLGSGTPANPSSALIEQPKQQPDPYENCEVARGYSPSTATIIELQPGKSFLFSLPREALCRNLRAYISYQYNWESEGFDDDEPEHRVYFYGRDLPKEAAEK
jgi:hypothetical protein